VALARALVFSPEILLLDEPLGALDRKLRKDVQVELKELHRRVGTTFIYVTHDQEEALSMSDRVAILRNGRIVQVGSPRQLYERPNTRFVADFLGESNFLRGTVLDSQEGMTVYEMGDNILRHRGTSSRDKPTLMALRPEKIRVGLEPLSQQDNAVEMVVQAFTYLGATISFTLYSAGIGKIQAVEPAWRAVRPPAVGTRVWASWSPESTVEVADD
jgi:ABC-type Fe3+/spermidine/putrescine transport system ATPase subunit